MSRSFRDSDRQARKIAEKARHAERRAGRFRKKHTGSAVSFATHASRSFEDAEERNFERAAELGCGGFPTNSVW